MSLILAIQIGLRKIVSTKKSETNFNFLVSSYLRKDCFDSFVQKKQFFKLIQLLSFIRSLEYSKQFIDDQVYYNNKSEYQSLIIDYLSQKIGSGSFIMTFLKLFGIDKRKLMNKDFKKLSVFSIDPQFYNFAAFMSKIFEDCEWTEQEFENSI